MNVPPHELNCYVYSEDAIKDQSRNIIVQSEEVKIPKYPVEKNKPPYLSFYYIVERRGFSEQPPPRCYNCGLGDICTVSKDRLCQHAAATKREQRNTLTMT